MGAGTVLTPQDVNKVRAAGGKLIVSPNCDPQVIRHALGFGMRVMPGIATATEAFAAVHAGATELKLFPASTYGSGHLRALKSVLPTILQRFKLTVVPYAEINAQIVSTMLCAVSPVRMQVDEPDGRFAAQPVRGSIHSVVDLGEALAVRRAA